MTVRDGESGDKVYRRSDGAAYAKISMGSAAVLLDGERRRSEWLAPFGVGTATVLDWITSDDAACLITSAVPGVDQGRLDFYLRLDPLTRG
jgi:streptomycin 3"-kinase